MRKAPRIYSTCAYAPHFPESTITKVRAVTLKDGALTVEECPEPTPGAGEVLVRVRAAGGVGTAAVQLGRAAGADVTGTVRNEELRPRVEDLGARAIDPESFEDHG